MRKNATPNTTEAPVQRTMLRSRTTMSYKFTEALAPYFHRPLDQVPAVASMVAAAIPSGFRKRPSWTVSKRPEKARKRR